MAQVTSTYVAGHICCKTSSTEPRFFPGFLVYGPFPGQDTFYRFIYWTIIRLIVLVRPILAQVSMKNHNLWCTWKLLFIYFQDCCGLLSFSLSLHVSKCWLTYMLTSPPPFFELVFDHFDNGYIYTTRRYSEYSNLGVYSKYLTFAKWVVDRFTCTYRTVVGSIGIKLSNLCKTSTILTR